MSRTGRPPVPLERKKKLGHLREDRLPQGRLVKIENAGGDLEPPPTLEEAGLDLWHRVAASAPWLWRGVDNLLLQILCEQVDERQALRATLSEGLGDWRDRNALRALERQIVDNLSLLGFTPTDRARLGLLEVQKTEKMSALEEMWSRAEAIRNGS